MEPGVSEEVDRRKAELSCLVCYKHLPKLGLKLPGTGYCVECPDYKPVERREHLIYALLWQMVTLVINEPDKREQLWEHLLKAYTEFNLDGFPFQNGSPEEYSMSDLETVKIFRNDFNSKFNFISMIYGEQADKDKIDSVLLEPPKFNLPYDNLGKIGEGGFGSVYKVTNQLEAISYALKVVPFRYKSRDSYEIMRREIRQLTSLRPHPNLIPYKAFWLEKFIFKKKSGLSKVDKMADQPSETAHTSTKPAKALETKETTETTESWETPPESSTPSGSPLQSTVIGSAEEVETLNQLIKSKCTLIENKICNNASSDRSHGLAFGGSLYILTPLCGKNLKTWIEERNDRLLKLASNGGQSKSLPDLTECLTILKQILIGLKVTHDKKVIHGNLKPENILLGLDGRWKIGDFGLAKIDQCIDKLDTSALPTQQTDKDYTVGLGTSAFTAPEQLNKVFDQYDNKVDIFSIGMVTFELFHPFGTNMERSKAFDDLRGHSLPEDVTASFPKVAKMILKMTSRLPADRPDAVEILHSDLFSHDGHMLKVNPNEAAIRRMQEETGKLDIEIKKVMENFGQIKDGVQKLARLISPMTVKCTK